MGAQLFVLVATVKARASHILAKLGPESWVRLGGRIAGHDCGSLAPGRGLEPDFRIIPLIGRLADDTPRAQGQYGRLNGTDLPQGREMAPIPAAANLLQTNPPSGGGGCVASLAPVIAGWVSRVW